MLYCIILVFVVESTVHPKIKKSQNTVPLRTNDTLTKKIIINNVRTTLIFFLNIYIRDSIHFINLQYKLSYSSTVPV